MDGILIIDKPAGVTSHDVVQRVRRATKQRRVGHAGTLDPLATGVLVLGLGVGTRLLEFLSADDKEYDVTARLGVTSASYDTETELETTDLATLPNPSQLITAVQAWRGPIEQVPPVYSAIKVQGKSAHARVRAGETVQLAPRQVTIVSSMVRTYNAPEWTMTVACSKGTYIRSLVHDIGQTLGAGAVMSGLRRTRSGIYSLDQAVDPSWWELEEDAAAARLQAALRPLSSAIAISDRLPLTLADWQEIQHGRPIANSLHRRDVCFGFWRDELRAVLVPVDDQWRPKKVFL